jgi:hypothetical protein
MTKKSSREELRKVESANLAGLLQLLNNEHTQGDLNVVIKNAAQRYSGDLTQLESMFGALVAGQLYGWKVLRLIHSGATYAKYEKHLGVKFRDVCPEVGPLAHRSHAYALSEQMGNFWRMVRGQDPGRSPTVELDEQLHAGIK